MHLSASSFRPDETNRHLYCRIPDCLRLHQPGQVHRHAPRPRQHQHAEPHRPALHKSHRGSPCDPRLDITSENDPVQALSTFGLILGNNIPNAIYRYRNKSKESFGYRHSDLKSSGSIWEELSRFNLNKFIHGLWEK